MELYYEEEKQTNKKSKAPIFIGIFILLLVILTAVIIYFIMYLKSNVLKVKIDGVSRSDFTKLIVQNQSQTSDEIEMYFPIRKIAKYFGYSDYSGDFKTKSEDSTKCYVDNNEEIAMFTQNSDTLIVYRENTPLEEFTLDKRVIESNGELYTTIDGIEKAFNILFNYNKENNLITIYTVEYLAQSYATQLQLTNTSDEFADKKAVLNGMMIFQDNQTKKYGVINVSTKKFILEAKYDSISYLPFSNQFLVQSNKKYGIMDKNSRVKLKIAYDDIKVGDNKNGLYVVKENDLYGVVDNAGNIIIASSYDQIGVNSGTFEQNGIENEYVLLNEIIPVKRSKAWGFFNIKGEKISDLIYTDVGCNNVRNVTNAYPAVVIPGFNAIIVKAISKANEEKYTIINIKGEQLVAIVLDSVYLTTDASSGKNTYYLTYNGKTENAEERLAAMGY